MIVIDNFFDNPDVVRNIALHAKYFTKENHPGDIAGFPGFRTNYLNEWTPDLYSTLESKELEIVKQLIDIKEYTEYWTKISFSWTGEDVLRIPHVDFQDQWNGSRSNIFFLLLALR